MQHPTTEQLIAYVSGSLSEGEQVEMAAHLQKCEPCQRLVEMIRSKPQSL